MNKMYKMVEKSTSQMEQWTGSFGKEYTDRNACLAEEMDARYKQRYGITRSEMNSRFIGNLEKDIKILEVGSNIGNQLCLLQNAGFLNLYGIELQSYAVELAKSRTSNINIIQGSAFDIPFKDGFFSLVFTSGVLIHIAPQDIGEVLDEIYRCTSKYIWCFEYFADEYTQVRYHGNDDLLWKTNFSGLFIERFKGLGIVKEEHYKYLEDKNVDTMFLLEKND